MNIEERIPELDMTALSLRRVVDGRGRASWQANRCLGAVCQVHIDPDPVTALKVVLCETYEERAEVLKDRAAAPIDPEIEDLLG